MKHYVSKLNKIYDKFNKFQAYFLALILANLVILLLGQIIWRYIFNSPIIWSEELARYFFVWVTLIGASWAGHQHYHVSMTYVVSRFPDRARRIQQIIISLICAIISLVLIRPSYILFAKQSQLTAITIGVSLGIQYWVGPIGLFLLFIQQTLDALLAIFDWSGYKNRYHTVYEEE